MLQVGLGPDAASLVDATIKNQDLGESYTATS